MLQREKMMRIPTFIFFLSIISAPLSLSARRGCTPQQTKLARKALRGAAHYIKPISGSINQVLAPVFQVAEPALQIAGVASAQSGLGSAVREVNSVIGEIKKYTHDTDALLKQILHFSGGSQEARQLIQRLKSQSLSFQKGVVSKLRSACRPLVRKAGKAAGQLASKAVGKKNQAVGIALGMLGTALSSNVAQRAVDKAAKMINRRLSRVRKTGVNYLECMASPVTNHQGISQQKLARRTRAKRNSSKRSSYGRSRGKSQKKKRARKRKRRKKSSKRARAGSSKMGKVLIRSRSSGANVLVDGKFRGRTPMRALMLKPGIHRIRISKKGKVFTKKIKVSPGRTQQIKFKL